jgi:cell division protein FtsL
VLGFRKSAIQVKGAEKFFEKENKRREKARKRAARRGTGGAKRLIILVIVLAVMAALGMLVRNQQTQIAQLRALRDREIETLRTRVSTLSAELEESDKQVRTLKDSIAGLEKQVEAEQSERVRAEAAVRGRSPTKRKL